jgi:uncharacterized membrane protein
MRRLLLAAVLAALMIMASAGAAFAGEVKGPSRVNNEDVTGALDHARSACAASGLNDLIEGEGQTDSRVQTAADSWKYYGLPKGSVGTLCNPVKSAA